jgi:polyferredoxin
MGDCIDCKQCKLVCPTGIDIRNGTQLECINCTACIDACNHVMKRTKKPVGLIRYASEKGIAMGQKIKLNPRIISYSAVLIILITVSSFLLFRRKEIKTTILRSYGTMYQEYDETRLGNLYDIQIINRSNKDLPIHIKLVSHTGELKLLGDEIIADKQELHESRFFLLMDKRDLNSSKTEITFGIFAEGEQIEKIKSTFVGPNVLDK